VGSRNSTISTKDLSTAIYGGRTAGRIRRPFKGTIVALRSGCQQPQLGVSDAELAARSGSRL
jgi:hypothetical protein